MRLSDNIELKQVHTEYDNRLNEVEVVEWLPLGKCIITPNTAARLTRGNDGKEYVYSYEIIMKIPKNLFGQRVIPKENDEVHIVKEDGSIDKVCKVSGFVTMRSWLKIWV